MKALSEAIEATSIISRQEMELNRAAPDYIQWFLQKWSFFSEVEELRRILREKRDPILKKLSEESYPLYMFLLKKGYGQDISVQHYLGSQNFDCILRKENSSDEYLEITSANLSEEESLRMQVLSEKGDVSVLGSVTKIGTKSKGRIVSVKNEAVEHSGLIDSKTQEIVSALKRKIKKGNYPQNTTLLVNFEDYFFKESEDLEVLLSETSKVILDHGSNFSAIYLVGSVGKVFLRLI